MYQRLHIKNHINITVFAKTAGPWTEQGRNFKVPTVCSLLSDRMSDKNILYNSLTDILIRFRLLGSNSDTHIMDSIL